MKPITIKAPGITPVLEAARELVLAVSNYWAKQNYGDARAVRAIERMNRAEKRLATLLGLERDEKTGRYRDD